MLYQYTLNLQACICDTSVQAVAKAQQNFTPSQFQIGESCAFVLRRKRSIEGNVLYEP